MPANNFTAEPILVHYNDPKLYGTPILPLESIDSAPIYNRRHYLNITER